MLEMQRNILIHCVILGSLHVRDVFFTLASSSAWSSVVSEVLVADRRMQSANSEHTQFSYTGTYHLNCTLASATAIQSGRMSNRLLGGGESPK